MMADRNIRWAHRYEGTFSDVAAKIFYLFFDVAFILYFISAV